VVHAADALDLLGLDVEALEPGTAVLELIRTVLDHCCWVRAGSRVATRGRSSLLVTIY
jgi:hypothetical protein